MRIMSRIAILEVKAFLVTLQTSNAEARTWLKAFQQAVIGYTKESRVSGKAVEASKAYFEASYMPLVDTVLQAMDMSEALLAQYIQDFYSQVDATPDTYIDAELLQDVMADVRRLKREKERLAQSMGGGMGTTLQGQQQTYSMQLYEVMEEEKILEKYIAFEQSHTHFFAPFRELVHAVQRAVDALQNQVHFNAETGMYSVAKTFMSAMQRLQQSLNEARGIDPKREAQLEGYLLFKVPYTDSNGKEQVMWLLEKDGVRVPNRELEAYLKRTGDYQAKDKYTILTLDELNEKIMKSWQNKTYYMDGKVYSGAAGKILQASAYVEDWEGKLSEAGVMDAITGVGLSLAAISGSVMYRGRSIVTVQGNKNVMNEIANNKKFYKDYVNSYDCSEIAEDLYEASGNKGNIYEIKSKSGGVNIKEYGQTEKFEYHSVYSDGKYIYDPRYSDAPILEKSYFKKIKKWNPDGIDITKH